MYDSPVAVPSYNSSEQVESSYERLCEDLGEDTCKKLDPILEALTIKQLRSLRDYIMDCTHHMEEETAKTVTMKDFDDAKKDTSESEEETEGEE